MQRRNRIGIVFVVVGTAGIGFLLYQGTPIFALEDIGSYSRYIPAAFAYLISTAATVFGILVLSGIWPEKLMPRRPNEKN